MSVFKGLQKIAEAAVDVVMVVPDVAVDAVVQDWHDPEVPSRTGRRLKRVARRLGQGISEVYKNSEENVETDELRKKFTGEK